VAIAQIYIVLGFKFPILPFGEATIAQILFYGVLVLRFWEFECFDVFSGLLFWSVSYICPASACRIIDNKIISII